MAFTEQHKIFMVMSYYRNGVKEEGTWQYSIGLCMEEFREEFPDFSVEYTQFRQTLNVSFKNFQENGSVTRKPGSGCPKRRTPELIEEPREVMEETPGTSIRHLSQQLGLSVGTCNTLLEKDLHLFPYRLTSVHELHPTDFPQRVQYCEWFLNTLDLGDHLEKTFFIDEAYFHLSGYGNSQNTRIWTSDNPHFFIESPQYPQQVGVWAAINQHRIIGPIFLWKHKCCKIP
ncbi:hypothetical protein Zmor_026777 [Zophobas morio]|uniref:DUF4817 domain-containing protein n=1 Tax=Zophobas morio TaxID=2755281 RepID=A0AA38HV42_9CUCU|nr:hypothetical protein Zmor_026777 [Zophobas morio]